MSIAALRDENEQLKALLAQTQAALSEHQAGGRQPQHIADLAHG
jgi:hypothetical protein